jgi:magnesium chelatase family protein
VELEADIGAGLSRTVLVGLPDSALYQARDRCKAAISNSGQEWPMSLLTINLSLATLPKAGSHYDIAIVAAVLAAQGVFGAEQLRRTALLGEVGLDGRLRPVRGVLPATLAAQKGRFHAGDRPVTAGRRGAIGRRHRGLWNCLYHPIGRLSPRRADAAC